MAKLSTEKMQEIRNSLGLTYDDIAEKTGISKSTITKLFGGFQINPSIDSIAKIAEVMECEVDDFIKRDSEPTSPYYLDKKTAELAQKLKDDPQYSVLLDATKDLSPEDVNAVLEIVKMIKRNKNG